MADTSIPAAHHLIAQYMEIRRRSGRKLNHLAQKAGYHYKTISAWENNVSEPSLFAFDTVLRAMDYKLVIEPTMPSKAPRVTDFGDS